MRLAYRLLNVFAQPADPFSGNPLCVFEDGSGLTDDQMQALARQFKVSDMQIHRIKTGENWSHVTV